MNFLMVTLCFIILGPILYCWFKDWFRKPPVQVLGVPEEPTAWKPKLKLVFKTIQHDVGVALLRVTLDTDQVLITKVYGKIIQDHRYPDFRYSAEPSVDEVVITHAKETVKRVLLDHSAFTVWLDDPKDVRLSCTGRAIKLELLAINPYTIDFSEAYLVPNE
jgi:hypothetical protein